MSSPSQDLWEASPSSLASKDRPRSSTPGPSHLRATPTDNLQEVADVPTAHASTQAESFLDESTQVGIVVPITTTRTQLRRSASPIEAPKSKRTRFATTQEHSLADGSSTFSSGAAGELATQITTILPPPASEPTYDAVCQNPATQTTPDQRSLAGGVALNDLLLAQTPRVADVTAEELEALRSRNFQLASDFHRLYNIFCPDGEQSPHHARFQFYQTDMRQLNDFRKKIANLAHRVQNARDTEDSLVSVAVRRSDYKNLLEVVEMTIKLVTWLRRELEGDEGYEYPYEGWFFEVIGNNPLSRSKQQRKLDRNDTEGS